MIINGQKIQRIEANRSGRPCNIFFKKKSPKKVVTTESNKLNACSPVVPGKPRNSLSA